MCNLLKIKSAILMALVIVLCVSLLGGCAVSDSLYEKAEEELISTKDVFLAHMEGKYDTIFFPISYSSTGVVTNEEFRCYAIGTDPERDYVTVVRRDENGEEVFYDDYFGILIRDEYQNRVQDICDSAVEESKAFVYQYSAPYFSNSLTEENTLDDAIALGESITASKYVFIEVNPGDEEAFERICDQIHAKMTEAELTGFISFMGLAEGHLQNITEDNYMDYLPSMVVADGEICLMITDRSVRLP